MIASSDCCRARWARFGSGSTAKLYTCAERFRVVQKHDSSAWTPNSSVLDIFECCSRPGPRPRPQTQTQTPDPYPDPRPRPRPRPVCWLSVWLYV